MSTLVVPAWRLRWQAPELALVLGERALAIAAARRDEADRLKAEALVVFASNRIGRGVRIADRALDALKAAEAVAEHQTAWLLRIELAGCARSVGAPLTGFAAVRPVLEAQGVPYALRAAALVEASECIVTVGRGDEPAQALEEADRLYASDTILDQNTKLLLRGLLRAVSAAQFRRWGDISAAIGAAREGLELLDQADPVADSGQARGRLTLELVCALMDANKLADASEAGTPLLDRPVRAPSASTSGWLRLALATRVHLPAGRVQQAREMLRDAAGSAERHQLDTLLAESLLALAHVHEVSGELADALTNLRSAHAAERRRARAVYAVRARLAAEFSGVHRQPSSLHQQLAELLRADGGPPRPTTDTALPAELKQQLRQWRPVQVRKGEGLKVKRVRRAAEDMSVEGLSAARAHAADRWRMVHPFGEPEDKTPEPVEPPPPTPPQSDRTVPAAGLIASAGAMISGRRRAARVAAGDIDDEPAAAPVETPAAPPAPARAESVLDMLKAAGLREGGRRRAPDPDDDPAPAEPAKSAEPVQPVAPAQLAEPARHAEPTEPSEPASWRAEAPAHLRAAPEPPPEQAQDLPAQDSPVQDFFAPAIQAVPDPDNLPARPPRSGLAAAFGREPSEPHYEFPTAEPSETPDEPDFPATPSSDSRSFGPSDSETTGSAAPSFGFPDFGAPSPVEPEPLAQTGDSPSFGPSGLGTPEPESESPPAPKPDVPSDPPSPSTPSPEALSPEASSPEASSPEALSPEASNPEASSSAASTFDLPNFDWPSFDTPSPAVQNPAPSFDLPSFDLPSLDAPPVSRDVPEPPQDTPPVAEQPRPFGLAAAFGQGAGTQSRPEPGWRELRIPEPSPEKQPEPPEPEPQEPDVPDPVPSVPIPDEIPAPPEPDLLSDSFLSAADVDNEPRREAPTTELPKPGVPEPGVPSAPEAPARDRSQDLPSRRRRPSEQSLADLLAEALVAYETGRAEEQREEPQPNPSQQAPSQQPQPISLQSWADDAETTAPIKPVEAKDNETTGPIRPVGGGWTLPGS